MLEVVGCNGTAPAAPSAAPDIGSSMQMLSGGREEQVPVGVERPAVFARLSSSPEVAPLKALTLESAVDNNCGIPTRSNTTCSSRESSSVGSGRSKASSSCRSNSSGSERSLLSPGDAAVCTGPSSACLTGDARSSHRQESPTCCRAALALPSSHSDGDLNLSLAASAAPHACACARGTFAGEPEPELRRSSQMLEQGLRGLRVDEEATGFAAPLGSAQRLGSGEGLQARANGPIGQCVGSLQGSQQGGNSSADGNPLRSAGGGIPLFVMLPLDVISCDGELRNPRALEMALQALKTAGVEGVMGDVWWGLVERSGPKQYEWEPYKALLQMVQGVGLRMQAVMSFHACGNNVGDTSPIPLPSWVLDCFPQDPAIFFRDRAGTSNPECISLFSDTAECLAGRTPIQVYEDFMGAFKEAMGDYLGTCIVEVAVGMGPCGELRFPSYPEGDGRWRFPGIGEFQCFDSRALEQLRVAAEAVGQPQWGLSGPHDAGTYMLRPQQTGFFRHPGGTWSTPYGHFFLSWYSDALVRHQERMLEAAVRAFHGVDLSEASTASSGEGVPMQAEPHRAKARVYRAAEGAVHLSVKCAGIHWWYQTASHAAELTAGYYNPWGRNGYESIVQTCLRFGAGLTFTCIEMRDVEQPAEAQCGPEELVNQVRACASKYGVTFAGENALARLDQAAYDQMLRNATRKKLTVVEMSREDVGRAVAPKDSRGPRMPSGLRTKIVEYRVPLMACITFLRLTPKLFEEDNFARFMHFVGQLRAVNGTSGEGTSDGLSAGAPGVRKAHATVDAPWGRVVAGGTSKSGVQGILHTIDADRRRGLGSANYRESLVSSTCISPQGRVLVTRESAVEYPACATPPLMHQTHPVHYHGEHELHHNPAYYHSFQQLPQPHHNHHIVHRHQQNKGSEYFQTLSPTHEPLSSNNGTRSSTASDRSISPEFDASRSLGWAQSRFRSHFHPVHEHANQRHENNCNEEGGEN